jgi:ABC-type nitrate/sulfonate/bicarbonate transport system substrate-binding protein
LATLGGLGNTYPILVLARDDLLAREPEKVRRFLRALRRAEQFVQDQPERTAAILAAVTGLSPDVARHAMRRHTFTMSLDDTILASLRQTAEFLKAQGILPQVPDFGEVADAKYLTMAPAPEAGAHSP